MNLDRFLEIGHHISLTIKFLKYDSQKLWLLRHLFCIDLKFYDESKFKR